jgi:hypothetical protein
VAVATRRDSKDGITVFNVIDWAEQVKFSTATLDLQSIAWSPDASALVVADSNLRYALLVYSPLGDFLAELRAYEHALGIREVDIILNNFTFMPTILVAGCF